MPTSRTTRAKTEAQGAPGPPVGPYWTGPDARLWLGDVRACLRAMPPRSVHCAVTSPPYWRLRDYGTGLWCGGDPGCDHVQRMSRTDHHDKGAPGIGGMVRASPIKYRGNCPCGATQSDTQVGLEERHDCSGWATGTRCGQCYVCHLVEVFAELKRVLRDDGVAWLNLGDSHVGTSWNKYDQTGDKYSQATGIIPEGPESSKDIGLAPGNIIGSPWRVALAIQADGWVLRSDVPWVKRAVMPEPTDNRPTRSLEYVFMLTKTIDCYFDMDAVRVPSNSSGGASVGRVSDPTGAAAAGAHRARRYERPEYTDRSFRNGDLWFQSVSAPWGLVGVGDELVGLDVSTAKSKDAHFAAFPPRLIAPLILASTSECGCCADCGAPYKRVVEKSEVGRRKPERGRKRAEFDHDRGANRSINNGVTISDRTTVGWRQTCNCHTSGVVPAVVLDPFLGSGTAVVTALELGRAGVGIDLSEDYLRDIVVPRIGAVVRPQRPSGAAVPRATPPPARRLRADGRGQSP